MANLNTSQDRRRFPRLSLYADAFLMLGSGRSFPCKIRDFCVSGMAISWSEPGRDGVGPAGPLGKGEPVTVAFSGKPLHGAKEHHISATIARTLSDGLGLAFPKPDPAALQALRELADLFNRSQKASVDHANQQDAFLDTGQSRIDVAQLIRTLHSLCERHLTRQYSTFNNQVEQLLFRQAKNAQSNAESSALLDAIPAVTKRREQIATAAIARVLSGLESPGVNNPPPAIVPVRPNLEGTLSLLGKDEFEDLLALADIISRAEQRYKNKLFDLEQRFSYIFRRDIDRANDPLGPSSMCHAFADALQQLGLNELQRRAAYYAYQDVVIPLLANLYDDLNATLIDAGVLPSLRPAVRRQASSTPNAPNVTSELQSSIGRDYAHPNSGSHDQRPFAHSGPDQRPLRLTSSLAEDYSEVSHDLAYSAAQTLMNLNRLMASQNLAQSTLSNRSFMGTGTRDRSGVSNSYSRNELMHALLRMREQGMSADMGGPVSIKDQIMQALQNSGNHNASTRSLRPGDNDALDLIGSIVGAMLQDPRSNDAFREEVNRLQLPLHVLALQEPAFFSDKNHPARQFINRVAQLRGGSSLNSEQSLRHIIDRLLTEMRSTSNISSQLFAPALSELDALVDQQAKVYSDNVAQLIAECNNQQAVIKSKRKNNGEHPASNARALPAGIPPELANEFRLWMDRAERLQVPDLVNFEQADGRQKRLRVAWIGEDFSSIVFADQDGRKASNYTLQEMAMLLRRGKANIVSDANLGAVDRALHSVLYEMHDRIERNALSDPITGLPNRARFLQRLDSSIQSAVRDDTMHTLAVICVEGHRPLVEGFGEGPLHRLLQKFAEMITQAVGKRGSLTRLDDCSFAILLEGVAIEPAKALLTPCLQQIEKTRVKMHEQLFALKAALRATVIDGSVRDSEQLLTELERQSKFSDLTVSDGDEPELLVRTVQIVPQSTLDWADHVQKMLTQDRLPLFGRLLEPLPIGAETPLHTRVDVGVQDVNGEIVLLRHNILPADMQDMLLQLDRRIVKETLAWFTANPEELDQSGGCAVRLHAPALRDPQTIDFLLEQLIESGIPPGRVCIEISETDAAHCLTETERLIRTISEFGCTFCISAYGRGELSHTDLDRLSVGYLMLDPRMVKNVEKSNTDHAVVKSTAEIARLLGKKVLAEQVRSFDARTKLCEIGLDYAEMDYTPARPLREAR